MLIQSVYNGHIIFSERFNIMSVKVAIRVRPFNQREKFLGCICCVDMKQNTTILYQNRQKNKKQHYFTFDYSLWSHDEFQTREDGYMYPTTRKYVDQQKIYNVIGREMLENAWQGYNCCLFAYGQTGAGKSYSMIGYGVNRGIIPMACQQIFQKIKKHQRKGQKQYEITLSMLEIYNEKVQDLFVPTSKRPQNGLKIRENKTLGVYVEGLTKHEVFSYADIQRRMDEGSKNRSLASTLMNQYSSRAHTIVLMEFIQKQWINKLKMNKKSSFINLVDLAGSERVAKTGISDNKDRLKQASNINKSLHTLGRVIEILAEQAAGKGKNAQVPYRDSSLTRILQSALGGNSKTIMICAISPANDNYEETLSTLRYADQTKKIKNKPIVNQSAVDKIIRELRQQNQRLKKMLQAPQEPSYGLSNSREQLTQVEKKQMRSNVRASMREVQKEIKKNLKSFAINTDEIEEEEDSMMMTEFIDLEEPSQFFSELSFDLGNKAQVYITNLNEDELLNYKVRYSCEKDILITNKNNKKNAKGMQNFAKIVLCGLGIQQNHARITRNKDRYFIEALSQASSEYTLLNGKSVYEKRELQHNDRIILGINSVFIFKNSLRKPEQKERNIDYEFVMNERQQQMENVSLISPTSLNLFLSSTLMKNNPSKEIYANPPTQAYNNSKKLFQQENQKEILDKLSDIQKEFSKLVKENQEKLKQKEEFYRSKLTQLKQQKQKQKEQKSTLQQKLMMKSIESQTLRTKNSQLQTLKQKLSKYNEEKNRRKKLRQSMLLGNDDENGVIQEDIIGQFVDVQDPRSKNRNGHQIGIGPDAQTPTFKQKKKDIKSRPNRNSYQYQDVTIQECEDNEDVINKERRQSFDSLLLLDEDPITNMKKKETKTKSKQADIQQQLRLLKQRNNQMKKQLTKKGIMKSFQFRRLYNIKVKCEMEIDNVCQKCMKTYDSAISQESNPIDNSFVNKYLPDASVDDAQLEQYTYKGKQKKKMISQEQMLFLQQQIIELQSKLLAKDSAAQQEKFDNDEMLLNVSMDRLQQQINYRNSFGHNRKQSDSYAEIQLNLSQDFPLLKSRPELKVMIGDFIQVLADTPQLSVYKQASLKIMPTAKPRPKMKQLQIPIHTYYPKEKRKTVLQMENSVVNVGIEGPKHHIQLGFYRFQQFNYLSQYSFERNERTYKQQKAKSEEQLLNDISEDEVYEEEIIIKKKTQTKSKQQAQNTINKELIERDLVDKIVCQFGTNTELNEYEVMQREKANQFTTFLNEELEQTRQNNTVIDPHMNDNYQNHKQYAEIGINIGRIAQDEVKKEQVQVQTQLQTAEMSAVTDINMETYEDFRQNNAEEEGHLVEKQQGQSALYVQQQNAEGENAELTCKDENTDQIDDEQLLQQYIEGQKNQQACNNQQQSDQQVEDYLQRVTLVDQSMNTSIIPQPKLINFSTNTVPITTKQQNISTIADKKPEMAEVAVNTSFKAEETKAKEAEDNEQDIQKYIEQQEMEEQIGNYLQNSQKLQEKMAASNLQNSELKAIQQYQKQIAQMAKITSLITEKKIKSLAIHTHQVDHFIYEEKQTTPLSKQDQIIESPVSSYNMNESPIQGFKQASNHEAAQIQVNQLKIQKFDIFNEAINIMIESRVEKETKQQEKIAEKEEESRTNLAKLQMIDEQVQINMQNQDKSIRSMRKKSNHSVDIENNQDSNKSSSNQYEAISRNRQKSHTHYQNKQKQLSNSQQIADKFNLSFSQIEKHEMSYQEMSVMGFDGLLKEEELNNKIKLLEDKIKELQLQQQPPKKEQQMLKVEQVQQQQLMKQEIPAEIDDIDIKASLLAFSKKEDTKNTSKYIPLKKTKKKKKKNQMTEQQRRQHQIQKEIQAKIIQCNNQNIINERNLQIHKRKREAEQLRKILVKKQKVQLQKQLLVLIPMVRRFNLIARQMKRLIQTKISVEYRNFSHYQMIEVLKSYSAKRRNENSNIQIKIVVLNCEEGRIYTWPTDVFKNRYEIAEQTFEKYLQNNEDPLSRSDSRSEKAKDPFWDPVDYIPQGIGYLSMEVLLYNLSYEGYISLVYKANIIAKIYISITPVKVKRHAEQDDSVEDDTQLEQMQIFNIRSLLEKDLYFTISIQSIKFLSSDESKKLDDSNQNINLTSLNSNILKYNISYELLQNDYRLVTFTTHDVDFVADKQFKKIDYMRRHSFQNISESTLAYMSDCPIKFTLNVMKDYHDQVLNASFNNDEYSEDGEPNELDRSMSSVTSGGEEKPTNRSRNQSINEVKVDPDLQRIPQKSDFTKKPSIIYENTQLINKLQTQAKKQQEKRDKIRKLEESRAKNSKAEKGDKEKECNIY